jgi:Uma2 family endonuclease
MELTLDLTKRYSYADYLTWWDDKRRELIEGFIKLMSPAANTKHALIVRSLTGEIYHYVKLHKGNCQVFTAPFDVRLPENGEKGNKDVFTVVQPDICVVCDPSKLDEKGCLGAPDLIIEVLSKSTRRYDLSDKYRIYEKYGVKEYWVVEPYSQDITIYLLQEDGKYNEGEIYDFIDTTTAKVPVHSIPGLEIDLNDIFN